MLKLVILTVKSSLDKVEAKSLPSWIVTLVLRTGEALVGFTD